MILYGIWSYGGVSFVFLCCLHNTVSPMWKFGYFVCLRLSTYCFLLYFVSMSFLLICKNCSDGSGIIVGRKVFIWRPNMISYGEKPVDGCGVDR